MNILKISRKVGLIDLFKEKGFKVGVEIGTDRGYYARDICKRFPEVKLFTIDPYIPFTEGDEVKDQQEMNKRYQEAQEVLKPYSNCELIKSTSMIIAKSFKPQSIDFVFIDGDHRYEAVYEDIVEWSKIVKKGGIVAGHDYVKNDKNKYGVIEAVDRFVKENNKELFILRKGTFVDCWMFYI